MADNPSVSTITVDKDQIPEGVTVYRENCSNCGLDYTDNQKGLIRERDNIAIVCHGCGDAYIPNPNEISSANLQRTISGLQGYAIQLPDFDFPAHIRAKGSELEKTILGLYDSERYREHGLTVGVGDDELTIRKREDQFLIIYNRTNDIYFDIRVVRGRPGKEMSVREGWRIKVPKKKGDDSHDEKLGVYAACIWEDLEIVVQKGSWRSLYEPYWYLPFEEFIDKLARSYLLNPKEVSDIQNGLESIPIVIQEIESRTK